MKIKTDKPVKQAKKKVTGQIAQIDGGWYLPENDSHFIAYAVQGAYQHNVYEKILVHTESRHVAIDIGAHVGFFSKRFCNDFDLCLAFEPVPTNFACLQENVTEENAVLVNVGSGEWGSRKLHLHAPQNSGSWSFVEPKEVGEFGTAPIMPLDCFSIPGPVSVIKLDIQGMEFEALQRGERTLLKHKPLICVEVVSDGATDPNVQPYLESLGATKVDQTKHDILMKWL